MFADSVPVRDSVFGVVVAGIRRICGDTQRQVDWNAVVALAGLDRNDIVALLGPLTASSVMVRGGVVFRASPQMRSVKLNRNGWVSLRVMVTARRSVPVRYMVRLRIAAEVWLGLGWRRGSGAPAAAVRG